MKMPLSHAFTALALMSLSLNAHAITRSQVYGDVLTRQAQTVYVMATTGMTTVDSEAAGSKETKATTDYELGGWLGEDRIVGIKISSEKRDVPFELNHSRSRTSFTDVRMQGRLWVFVPSVGLSLSEVEVSQVDSKTVDLFGTGISMGLGAHASIYPGLVLTANAQSVRTDHVYDKLGQSATLGQRDELDAHIAFDLTERLLDLIVGYKGRRYTVETEEQVFVEQSQGAYAGLRLGIYF